MSVTPAVLKEMATIALKTKYGDDVGKALSLLFFGGYGIVPGMADGARLAAAADAEQAGDRFTNDMALGIVQEVVKTGLEAFLKAVAAQVLKGAEISAEAISTASTIAVAVLLDPTDIGDEPKTPTGGTGVSRPNLPRSGIPIVVGPKSPILPSSAPIPRPGPEPNPEPDPWPGPRPSPNPAPEPNPNPNPNPDPNPRPDPNPEPNPEPHPDPPEPNPEPQPDPGPDPDPDPDPNPLPPILGRILGGGDSGPGDV